jgi:beta-1,2-mannosidase
MAFSRLSLAIAAICMFGINILGSGVPAQELPDWAMGPFVRPPSDNRVIKPDPTSLFDCPMQGRAIRWESLQTFNPAAVVHDGKICVLYRAEDDTGEQRIGGHTSRIGLAESEDGLRFTRLSNPIFYPDNDPQKQDEWKGGCEDPRAIATEDGMYVLTYTQWNGKLARLAVATSRDLLHWQKHGPAFAQAYDGKYKDIWTKSGAIVGKVVNGNLVATQINGKYWMYWGDGQVRLATSTDLKNWEPVQTPDGDLFVALDRRNRRFDSDLAEAGPPCVLTEKGILVLYNGENAQVHGDPRLGPGEYSAGQALFDSHDPTKLIARTDEPFFLPVLPFEKTGQYAAGTTFIEGLVPFKGKWFLYYGCADSFVGVAVFDGPVR